MTAIPESVFGPGGAEAVVATLKEGVARRHAEERKDARKWSALFHELNLDKEVEEIAELDPRFTSVSDGLDSLLDIPTTVQTSQPYQLPQPGLFATGVFTRPDMENRNGALTGVNVKKGRQNGGRSKLATVGRAGLISSFALQHQSRDVAISTLHPDLHNHQIESMRATDSFVQRMANDYLGNGSLPDWSKHLTSEIKQFFKLFHLASLPNAKTMTIRLDHDVAEAALIAPRGPADYLAGIIIRTLKKLGVESEITINLEFVHGSSKASHNLHLHGVFLLDDDQVTAASEALTRALAPNYRKRYLNVSVLIEPPENARWWASYCLKECDVTAIMLEAQTGKETSASYSTRSLSQQAKAFYERTSSWLGNRPFLS